MGIPMGCIRPYGDIDWILIMVSHALVDYDLTWMRTIRLYLLSIAGLPTGSFMQRPFRNQLTKNRIQDRPAKPHSPSLISYALPQIYSKEYISSESFLIRFLR